MVKLYFEEFNMISQLSKHRLGCLQTVKRIYKLVLNMPNRQSKKLSIYPRLAPRIMPDRNALEKCLL